MQKTQILFIKKTKQAIAKFSTAKISGSQVRIWIKLQSDNFTSGFTTKQS